MVQLVKSTRDFEIFGAQPWHDSTELAEVRQGEHRKFKSRSDFSQMRRFGTRNCLFRIIGIEKNVDLSPRSWTLNRNYWRVDLPFGELMARWSTVLRIL
jgi:hypothetical protein